LAKYSAMLKGVGLSESSVYRSTVPTFDAFFSKRNLRPLAEKWLYKLSENHANEPGLVWLFSNGGCWLYKSALDLLYADSLLPLSQRRFEKAQIGAVIYDSAPVWETPDSGSAALSMALFPKAPSLRVCTQITVRSLMRAFEGDPRRHNATLFSSLQRGLPSHRKRPFQLCVASWDDEITDFQHVEDFLLACRQKEDLETTGRRISMWRAPSPSPHCQHMLNHGAEYKKRVAALLEQAATQL